MPEGLVKFFIQRLTSLLLQETETFSGIEQQIEEIISKLREIGEFPFGDICCTKGDAAVCSCINELRDLIRDADDHIDEFIIQMDEQKGSDRSALTNCFTSQLQEIESRLAGTVHRMTELKNSTSVAGEKQDILENPHEMEEGQTSAYGSPAAANIREAEDSKETCREAEENQTSEAQIPITIRVEEKDDKEDSHDMEEGQTSSPDAASCILNYTGLPYYLQHCLMYCCLFPENYWLSKGKLIRLLVAEGLLQEKVGEIMEDIAEENISKLINQGMFRENEEHIGHGTMLTISPPYREFILHKMKEENLIATLTSSDFGIPHTARRVLIYSDMKTVAPHLNNIRPRSLFLLGNQELSTDHVHWLNFKGAKFVRVLELERTKINSLPDEVGDLIHLTYLGLKHTDINEIPTRIGNLRSLQTLDIKWSGDLTALPVEVLNLERLRHLKMHKRMNVGGVKLPPGIEKFRNILTLTGIHAGGGIARELSNLIHLRRLGVMDVAEEDVSELFASIMMMQNLLSLSLEAKYGRNQETLVLLESFSPPPLLRKLRLEGILEKIPNWFSSMENLTNLRLGFSHLSENPTLVLQLLPNLKILTLWHAYETRQLGKEFCRIGGFPKLEDLIIASYDLEEWTELEEGALPSLKCLHFHSCLKLRMLPEGLQFVTTLNKLNIFPLLDEHEERLKPGGEENHKINHIPQVSFILTSEVQQSFQSHPCTQRGEGECRSEG
ncbi:hypothetical protein ACOSQ2_024437 [Xanthoceras sorbifolium]|uniref:Uncharacterized protein n=1 Tax=Xanthoceras sorbifolium TaxID=99658 RepID=A0ABQ8H9B8_9ROSI|nr:hypothetical protein JRO89_XS13G0205300 [Xanthoceras sorbifolium]